MNKAALRAGVLSARDGMGAVARAADSRALTSGVQGLPEWQNAQTVLLYLGIKTEFDPSALAQAILDSGRTLALPRIVRGEHRLEIRQVRTLDQDLKPGVWGLREPDPEYCAEVDPARLDLILVPGVAFDATGGRMGYGAGFYDRLLSNPRLTALRVSALFETQLVDRVPREAHDLPVEVLVLPGRILRVAARPGGEIR